MLLKPGGQVIYFGLWDKTQATLWIILRSVCCKICAKCYICLTNIPGSGGEATFVLVGACPQSDFKNLDFVPNLCKFLVAAAYYKNNYIRTIT